VRAPPRGFTIIADPRRAPGRRNSLPVVLGIATGAIWCGMRGYKAISDWADALGQKARERFGCRREKGRYIVPSAFFIRDCLVRIEPGHLIRRSIPGIRRGGYQTMHWRSMARA
jgi:DDE_Tnp_1-associated